MIQIPRGTQDILPKDSYKWQFIEDTLKDVCEKYNYQEIRTPIFESTDLFVRAVGDTTDIVNKEMYTFKDKGDRSMTLRPEGTAPVVRSYIENKMYGDPNQPIKVFYNQPMFRYERQQKGRYRQFVQFGVEAIGVENPLIDVEILSMLMAFYESFGLKDLELHINSIGDFDSRKEYQKALQEHFRPSIDEFCSDCQSRIDSNPMRILDCKKDKNHPLMATAPKITDYLNEESLSYYEKVKSQLDKIGIKYVEDPNLVRGLDYYTHTAFELMSTSDGFGSITTLAGGGRYNGLVEMLDGPKETGIGFALSIERLLLALEAEGIEIKNPHTLDLYVVTIGEEARDYASVLLSRLRKNKLTVDMDYKARGVGAQFRDADRKGATYTIVLGENELETGQVKLKHMATGEEVETSIENLQEAIK
ncbi:MULTISPECIES: histidine--tRNA ligase [unclassified Nosocomiicoccus]|uniref:histidine--tRNA ligase n=1 Tax=unclassified Nosocomiicoccus TaxID=2646683 RepID=UPI0008A5A088|nr:MULTISPECIES: histidine--tRNA ligase [unclassified Nosocomiicoccus]OFL48138.1 histidine--tRNA ligase [Nosocomiicoccus sp. HMSC067E10]OFO51713.1 histidine--tRNA ligase [Nosocomiicoccus sp. HMSC059G07]